MGKVSKNTKIISMFIVISLFIIPSLQMGQAVVIYYPSSSENVNITDSSAAIVSHYWPSGHNWVTDGYIANAINITSIQVNVAWDGLGRGDILAITVAGLGTTWSGSGGDNPVNITVGAYLDPAQNTNPLTGMYLSIFYNGSGINVSGLQSNQPFVNTPAYEYTGWMAATAADFLAGPVAAAAVSGAFIAFHQLVNNLTIQPSYNLLSSSKVWVSPPVTNLPSTARPFSYLQVIGLAWFIPYKYVQNNYVYTLTVFTKTTYKLGFFQYQTNETDTYITIAPHFTGGGCVLKNTEILTPHGYKKVQSLKSGDEIVSLNPSTGNLTSSKINFISKTKVNEIESINNGELYLTPMDQPIYFKNSTNFGILINPNQLKIGDMLYNPVTGQWINITNISFIKGKFIVYDISVDYPSNFIANGILLVDKPKPI